MVKRGLIRRLRRVLVRAGNANLGIVAAGVAFFGLLSLFPGIALVIAIWSFVADPAAIRQEMELLADFIPADAYSLLYTQVDALMGTNSSGLGWTTFISLLVGLWSARAGVQGMMSALNAVHHRPDHGSVQGTLRALLLTLILVTVAMAALIAAIIVPLGIALLPLGALTSITLEIVNTLFALGMVVLGLALTYRFGPNRAETHRTRLLTPGLLVAVVLWFAVSRGFVLYLAHFNTYNKVYGSLGAVAILLMWLYLSAYAILLGAAVDAEIEGVPEKGLPPDPEDSPQDA